MPKTELINRFDDQVKITKFLRENKKLCTSYNVFIQSDLAKAIRTGEIDILEVADALTNGVDMCLSLRFSIAEFAIKNSKYSNVWEYRGIKEDGAVKAVSLLMQYIYKDSYKNDLRGITNTEYYKFCKMPADILEDYILLNSDGLYEVIRKVFLTHDYRLLERADYVYIAQAIEEKQKMLIDLSILSAIDDFGGSLDYISSFACLSRMLYDFCSDNIIKIFSKEYHSELITLINTSSVMRTVYERSEIRGLDGTQMLGHNTGMLNYRLAVTSLIEPMWLIPGGFEDFLESSQLTSSALTTLLFGTMHYDAGICISTWANLDIYLTMMSKDDDISNNMSQYLTRCVKTRLVHSCGNLLYDEKRVLKIMMNATLGLAYNFDVISTLFRSILENPAIRAYMENSSNFYEELYDIFFDAIKFACLKHTINKDELVRLMGTYFPRNKRALLTVLDSEVQCGKYNRLNFALSERTDEFVNSLLDENISQNMLFSSHPEKILAPTELASFVRRQFQAGINYQRTMCWSHFFHSAKPHAMKDYITELLIDNVNSSIGGDAYYQDFLFIIGDAIYNRKDLKQVDKLSCLEHLVTCVTHNKSLDANFNIDYFISKFA